MRMLDNGSSIMFSVALLVFYSISRCCLINMQPARMSAVRAAGAVLILMAVALIAAPAPAMAQSISISDNNTHVDRGALYSNATFLTASGGTAPYTFTIHTYAFSSGALSGNMR